MEHKSKNLEAITDEAKSSYDWRKGRICIENPYKYTMEFSEKVNVRPSDYKGYK